MWDVVGGSSTGGIQVREGKALSSPVAPKRLSTDALVKEVELDGQRLHYKLVAGAGPEQGWVSVTVKGRELLQKMPATSAQKCPSMRVFVIGGTGYIGRALVGRLLADGHTVLGLARNEASATALRSLGVEPRLIPDGFADVSAISAAAGECDAVVDVAAHQAELSPAVMGIRRALAPGKILLSTTGGLVYGDVPESKAAPVAESHAKPIEFEASVLKASEEGLRTCILRPPWVYGAGGGGMGDFSSRIPAVKQMGCSPWIDDGREGEISVVHVRDLADLYVLALGALASNELPSGSLLNAASGKVSHKAIAESLAGACGGLPVVAVSPAKAMENGWPWDIWTSSVVNVLYSTRAHKLGWQPNRTPITEELSRLSKL